MGYTHYWERLRTLPLPLFAKAAEDCRRLCEAMEIPLGDANGKGRPTFTDVEICFNGHVDSGVLASTPRGNGSIGPDDGARGITTAGAADATTGGRGARPLVTARTLAPTVMALTRPSVSRGFAARTMPANKR
jgi:hypothetical protein